MATTTKNSNTATVPAPAETQATEIKKAGNPLESSNPTVRVQAMIAKFMNNGTLVLPKDYLPENALKLAWLELQKLDLSKFTQESVINSLLEMAIQGMNVAKKQGYFIPYGNELKWQRSYFGDQALAKRINPDLDIYHSVIYEGDEVKVTKLGGRTVIMSHETTFGNSDKPVVGAYCGFKLKPSGEDLGAVVMTIAEIKKSWSMSRAYRPNDENGTHNKFAAEMALRTVIRKRCNPIFNTSNDAVLLASVKRSDIDSIEAEFNEEVEANANAQTLSLEQGGVVEAAAVSSAQAVDPDTGEVIPTNTVRDDQPSLGGEGAPF